MTSLPDEMADEAINEILVRAGHRKPQAGYEFRWAAEGARRVRDLDTLRDFLKR